MRRSVPDVSERQEPASDCGEEVAHWRPVWRVVLLPKERRKFDLERCTEVRSVALGFEDEGAELVPSRSLPCPPGFRCGS